MGIRKYIVIVFGHMRIMIFLMDILGFMMNIKRADIIAVKLV